MRGPMGHGRGGVPQKAKDFKGTLKKTLKYMRVDFVAILIAFVLAVGGVIATLLVPEILGEATDILMRGAMKKGLYSSAEGITQLYDGLQQGYAVIPQAEKDAFLSVSLQDAIEAARDGEISDEALAQQLLALQDNDDAAGLSLAQYCRTQTLGTLKAIAAEEGLRRYVPASIFRLSEKIPEEIEKFHTGGFQNLKNYETFGELVNGLTNGNPSVMIGDMARLDQYMDDIFAMRLDVVPQIDTQTIVNILIKILALVAASGILAYLQGFLLAGVAQRLSYRFRRDINSKIDKLPLKFFDSTTNGEVMSLITNDVDTISMSLNQSLSQLLTSVTTLVGVLIMMFRQSWQLTLISLGILPVTMVMILLVVRKSQKYFVAQQTYLGHVNGYIEEYYSGHNVVKLFNREHKSIEEFSKYNDELYRSAWNSQFYSGLMQPISQLIGNLSFAIVCIVGGALIIGGGGGVGLTIGKMQAFIQYNRQFNQPITQVASIANTLQSTIAAAERVFTFLEQEEEQDTGDLQLPQVRGDVSFEHIRFGYDPEKIIIKDFTCDVKQGQRIAIVGPTGAGKTTIVKLLMRFYELNDGAIAVDGHDITQFSRAGLREHVGMVLQDTWLFNGTIMENVRYGRLDATDEEVVAAAKIACADHFINTLPGGYDFEISSGATNVSQGQKQLLTIARAILADPKILILDEATSSVDTRTELLIQQAMERLMEGRTSFIIAHRLSTIRNADKILVLNEGDVVETGKHQELLDRNGFYAQLYNAQFEE